MFPVLLRVRRGVALSHSKRSLYSTGKALLCSARSVCCAPPHTTLNDLDNSVPFSVPTAWYPGVVTEGVKINHMKVYKGKLGNAIV